MPHVTRTYLVTEGNSVSVVVADNDVESWSYAAHTVDGTAKASPPFPETADYAPANLAGSGTSAYHYNVITYDDDIFEGDTPKEFYAEGDSTLVFADDDGDLYSVNYTGRFTFRIDDSADRPELAVFAVGTEANSTQSLSVVVNATKAASFDYPITIRLGAGNAGTLPDFGATEVTVIMPAYQKSVTAQLQLLGDTIREVDSEATKAEAFTITAQSSYSTASTQLAVANDDGPTLTLKSETGEPGKLRLYETDPFGAITITLSEAVPYDIDVHVSETKGAAQELTFVTAFRIPAGLTTYKINLAQAVDDGANHERIELGQLTFTAAGVGTSENVYFDAAGARSANLPVELLDSVKKYLDKPDDQVAVWAGRFMTARDTLIDGMKHAVQSGEDKLFLNALGKATQALGVLLDAGLITAKYQSSAAQAEREPNPHAALYAARVNAIVDVLDGAAKFAYGLRVVTTAAAAYEAAAVVAGAATAFGAAPAIAGVFAVVAVGVVTNIAYEQLSNIIKPRIKDFIYEQVPPSAEIGPRADLNGDGRSDILLQSSNGQLHGWAINGFQAASLGDVGANPGPSWRVIESGAFNGDGQQDILWQSSTGQLAIWVLDGPNPVYGADVGSNPGAAWQAKAAADFDGDGRNEVLLQHDNGQAAIWSITPDLQVGGGYGLINVDPSWRIKEAADFNGDGMADILWQNTNGQAAVWLMNGTVVAYGAGIGFNPGPSWHVAGASDMNGDGDSDVVWQADSGEVAIWLMDGANPVAGASLSYNPGPSWHVRDTGDYDGDGRANILLQNDDGSVAVWNVDGLSLTGGSVIANPGTDWHVV